MIGHHVIVPARPAQNSIYPTRFSHPASRAAFFKNSLLFSREQRSIDDLSLLRRHKAR